MSQKGSVFDRGSHGVLLRGFGHGFLKKIENFVFFIIFYAYPHEKNKTKNTYFQKLVRAGGAVEEVKVKAYYH